MTTISDYMRMDHERCDQLFAESEQAVETRRWEEARRLFSGLQTELERHFQAEEQILFPIMEARTLDAMGPTGVMRYEHRQIREGLAEMAGAVNQEDRVGYLTAGETLLIMIQQHNVKEEQILYPMGDRLLGAEATELLDRLRSA